MRFAPHEGAGASSLPRPAICLPRPLSAGCWCHRACPSPRARSCLRTCSGSWRMTPPKMDLRQCGTAAGVRARARSDGERWPRRGGPSDGSSSRGAWRVAQVGLWRRAGCGAERVAGRHRPVPVPRRPGGRFAPRRALPPTRGSTEIRWWVGSGRAGGTPSSALPNEVAAPPSGLGTCGPGPGEKHTLTGPCQASGIMAAAPLRLSSPKVPTLTSLKKPLGVKYG